MDMENLRTVQPSAQLVPAARQQTIEFPQARMPEHDFGVPERGTTGPVPIGQVMEPLERIIAHPDRNRLITEFFRRYW